jgi:DNA-binding MarR family transcriptional regulator
MGIPTDAIDRMIEDWREALPGLDPSGLELVGRVIVLAQHLERSVNTALGDHELTLGQFDILATLRRQGPKGGLTPKQLLGCVMLSSGGMTGRLDKLERDQLIARKPDPNDRR